MNKVLLLMFWLSFGVTNIALCVAVLGDLFNRDSVAKYAFATAFTACILGFGICVVGLSINL